MRVRWNTVEPPVPLDAGFDPENDPVIEVCDVNGRLCSVRKTQITGNRNRNEGTTNIYLWVDGVFSSGPPAIHEPMVGNHTLCVFLYCEDPAKQKQLAISKIENVENITTLTVSL